MSFPLEVINAAPSAGQIARARVIASEHGAVCEPHQVEQCGRDERGRCIHGCRCLHEAMESGSG